MSDMSDKDKKATRGSFDTTTSMSDISSQAAVQRTTAGRPDKEKEGGRRVTDYSVPCPVQRNFSLSISLPPHSNLGPVVVLADPLGPSLRILSLVLSCLASPLLRALSDTDTADDDHCSFCTDLTQLRLSSNLSLTSCRPSTHNLYPALTTISVNPLTPRSRPLTVDMLHLGHLLFVLVLVALLRVRAATTDEGCLNACSDYSQTLGYCYGKYGAQRESLSALLPTIIH